MVQHLCQISVIVVGKYLTFHNNFYVAVIEWIAAKINIRIPMEISEETYNFWTILESDLKTKIQDHIKNSFR